MQVSHSNIKNKSKVHQDESTLEHLLFDQEKLIITNEPTNNKRYRSVTDSLLEPAWHDEDEFIVNLNSVNRLKKLMVLNDNKDLVHGEAFSTILSKRFQSKPLQWAEPSNEQDLKSDGLELLTQSNSFVENNLKASRVSLLNYDNIDMSKLLDANYKEPSCESVDVTKFNSTGDILLCAGRDKCLRLFRIDGGHNNKLISAVFNEFKITCGDFITNNLNQSNEIIVCGKVPFFYSYDITTGAFVKIPGFRNKTGKETFDKMVVAPDSSSMIFTGLSGYGHVYNTKQKTLMFDIKMNDHITSSSYLDSLTVVTSNNKGDVYLWDIRYSNKFVSKFTHDNGLGNNNIACHAIDQSSHGILKKNSFSSKGLIAIGSESGVSTLYDQSCNEHADKLCYSHEKLKSFMNLTTPINCIKFHPSGEILAISSNQKKNQLRLIHTSSGRVFSNWPSIKESLGRVECFDFSPNGGYLAISQDKGKVLLYRLNHYTSS